MRLRGVEAVGFDLDGTLMDHPAAATAGAEALYGALGTEATPERLTAWFDFEVLHYGRWVAGELSFADHRRARIRDAATSVGATVSDAEADELQRIYYDTYRASWRLYPEIEDTLTRLRAEGIRLGVLTNGVADVQQAKIDALGLGAYLDAVCISEEVGVAKPEVGAFAALMTALATTPESMVFVGDDERADIGGARAAGIRASRVRSRGRTMAELGSAVRRAAAMPHA